MLAPVTVGSGSKRAAKKKEARRPRTLADRIAVAMSNLTPRESAVVHFFANHSDDVVFMSAVEIGAELKVGTATVIRAAQALGYAGLPALKRELRETMKGRGALHSRIEIGLEDLESDADVSLENTLSYQISLLNKMRQTIRPEEFRRAVEFLTGADRIGALGFGRFPAQAHDFMVNLRRNGYRAFEIVGRGDAMADDLLELRRGDVVVVMGYSRLSNELAVLFDLFRQRSVRCVLISDGLAVGLKSKDVVVLVADRGGSSHFYTTVVLDALLESLLFALVGHDRQRSVEAWNWSDNIRRRLQQSRTESHQRD